MRIDIESIREEIQSKLIDYLKRQNVEVTTNGSRKFRCINPKHNDQTPSASVIPGSDEREWHCFGCQTHGDIFTAAHYLENKPIDGPGFLEENLLYLANLYHIKVPMGEVSEEDARKWRMRRAYRIAYQYMMNNKDYSPAFLKEIERRKWPLDRVRDLGVGQIRNYAEFREFMVKQDGLDAKLLEEIDLLGPRAEWMFGENRVVFVLLDEYSRPCGFSARNLDYIKSDGDQKDPNGPKYKNTSSVGLYEKRKLVYNLDQAKRFQQDQVFILEGYADVIASRLAGFDNVVALGGVHLTDEHIMLMRNLGLTHLVLALDGDATGVAKTGEMITKLGDYPGIRVDVLRLPPNSEEKDVDGYIRKNGTQAWAEAQNNAITAFRWQLQNRSNNEDKYVVLDKAIKSIVPIQFPAQIYQMCEELSKELDIPLEIIRDEVKTHKNADDAQREAELIAFSDSVKKQIERRPQDIKAILTRADNFLSTIDKRVTWNPIDSSDQINKLAHHIKREEETSDSRGIIMGWSEFDTKMHGIPPNDTWIVLGGKANAGKSSMCANMIYNGLKNNQDLIAIIYTIDDSYGRFLPRLISLDSGLRSSWVSKRKIAEKKNPGIIQKVQKSYDYFRDLIRQQRLYIWDIRDGNTWTFANRQLDKLRQDNPKAKILMVLDNFHLLQDFTGGESVQNYARLSNMVANTVKEQEIALISTVEYHKLRKRVRPENQSIHFTQQLEYDSHLMLHMINYNDEFGEGSKLFWNSNHVDDQTHSAGPDGALRQVGRRKPIVEVVVGKSKLEEFKGNIFFEFDPARCKFNECNEYNQKYCRENYLKHPWLHAKSE